MKFLAVAGALISLIPATFALVINTPCVEYVEYFDDIVADHLPSVLAWSLAVSYLLAPRRVVVLERAHTVHRAEPILLTYGQGTAPYYLSILPGRHRLCSIQVRVVEPSSTRRTGWGNPGMPRPSSRYGRDTDFSGQLHVWDPTNAESMTWIVDIPAGTAM